MLKPKLAPSGLELGEDMSAMEYYGVYPYDLPSQFSPRDFPPREPGRIKRSFSRTQVRDMINI